MLIELLSARYPGMRRWLTQRLCAVSMAVVFLAFLARIWWLDPHTFSTWQAVFSPVVWRLLAWWFFICMAVHARLGVKDVLRDYVPHLATRDVLQWGVEASVWIEVAVVTWLFSGFVF